MNNGTKVINYKKDTLLDDAVLKIKDLLTNARKIIFKEIDNQSLKTYWQVGGK